jgi:hypothetical protein
LQSCGDHVLIRRRPRVNWIGFSEATGVITGYVVYNTVRTHRSLDRDAPVSRPVQRIGRIVSHALVGGLHHQYARI